MFGKSREGYYSVSLENRNQKELTEQDIINSVKDIRSQAPGIGAYKMFLILKDIYPKEMHGRDWFYKMMHTHHLMLKPERKRHTTNSNHNYHKYKNLIKEFVPTGINQLWVADITYIDTDDGVVYLHLLTDAFTHEIIGWTLSENLKAVNTLAALDMGISIMSHFGFKKLIHHSDRGSQYCCNAYIERLHSIESSISMTEDYKPTDNAIAERVNGILKQEWLYRMKRPKDLSDAMIVIKGIIDFYNWKRPHMNNMKILPPGKFREILTAV